MAWKLQFDPAAEKELGKLDKAVQRTVILKIDRRDSAY